MSGDEKKRRDSLKSPALIILGYGPSVLGGYCHFYLFPDYLLQLPDLIEAGVVASLGLAVEEGLAVQVYLQASVAHGGNGHGDVAMKLAEELSRYPSGLG